jgi:hypothetical protein
MRAFNDGRWLETEVKLAEGGNSVLWRFALGEFKTKTVMRINENGEWTEPGELIISDRTAENDGFNEFFLLSFLPKFFCH